MSAKSANPGIDLIDYKSLIVEQNLNNKHYALRWHILFENYGNLHFEVLGFFFFSQIPN